MKLFKRLMAVMFALTLTLGMGTRVYAEEKTYTITITKDETDKAAHTYGAYQIFTGKLEKVDGKDVLSDIQWGDGVTGATVITNLNAIKDAQNKPYFSIPATASAADVAKAIGDKQLPTDDEFARKIADAINASLTSTTTGEGGTIAADATTGTITKLPAGYYLVKDTGTVNTEGAYTRYILQVVSDVNVSEKADIPSVTKKVKEKDDNSGEETDWQDAADYDIGDSIPYKLEGTLPSKFADFATFTTYTFTDKLSAGLTPPAANTVTVKVGETDVTSHFDVAVSDQNLTISLKSGEDLKTWSNPVLTKDSKFVVEYAAVLNEGAVIGSHGNPNTVDLEFSNNPNVGGTGTGKTPEDKVIVFTYEIKALKVEPDGAAIDQAAYDVLDDSAKADYVKVGDKWQKTKALSGAGFTLFKKVNGSYKAVGEEITGVTEFEFKGTDAGEYKLVETKVPGGYNKAADIEIKVDATYDTDSADPKLKTLTVTPEAAGFTVTTTRDAEHITTDGIISGKILNQKGSTLPSTGGIGTTIFYVLGGLLVAGAGIVLVARKKAAE